MSENIEFTKKGNKDKDKDQSMTELSKFSEVFPNIEENNIEKLDSDNATKEGTNDSDISSDSINNISELPIKIIVRIILLLSQKMKTQLLNKMKQMKI